MARPLNFYPIPEVVRSLIIPLSIWVILYPFNSQGQSLVLEREVELQFEVHNTSIDREGHLYFADKSGDIHKYNFAGDSILSYSSNKISQINLIEAWNGLKVFVFLMDLQKFIFLDRNLRASPFYSFDPQSISFVSMATISSDGNIWILDAGDFALKKYNPDTRFVELSTSLDMIMPANTYEAAFMKEYQNLIFINDFNTGIYVFDNMGSYLKVITIKEVENIGFIGNKMYFPASKGILLYDIYDGSFQELEFADEQKHIDFDFALLSAEFAYLIKNNLLAIFKRK